MNFLKNIFNNSNRNQQKGLLCGIGKSEINNSHISIKNYPFEPSIAYPKKNIEADEISCVCIDSSPLKIKVTNDIIFITVEKKEKLKNFANRNKIPFSEQSWNWDWILEPYLDTEFTATEKKRTLKTLAEIGFENSEVENLRNEIGKQMFTYNFNTMLWEWVSLNLSDVLSAMRVKYNKEMFRDFYARAIEIELRGNKFES